MVNNAVLIVVFVFFVALAGLFAGSETGLYRLSRLRLRLGVEKKRLPFIMLGRCIHDSSGLLLSMLIGTNLSYYLATNIVTRILLSQFATEHTAEIVTTLLITPILFVFSESVPKNLFLYRADLLMPYLAPFLYTFHKIMSFCGAIPLLRFISTFFARLAGSAYTSKTVISSTKRHTIQAILQDTHEEGILSSVQTDIINRLVKVSNVRVRLVMTPIDKVQTVDVNSDRPALLKILNKTVFSRLPVTGDHLENIVGFIDIYDVLGSSQEIPDLRNFIKPIKKLDMDTAVIDAIEYMRKENQKILLVTKAGLAGREKPLGIVTMKDLVEELLGELAEW
jgi:CBS domain containing-hemolysin-like protein